MGQAHTRERSSRGFWGHAGRSRRAGTGRYIGGNGFGEGVVWHANMHTQMLLSLG